MFIKNRVPGDQHDAPKPAKVRVPMFHVPLWAYLPWLGIKLAWKLLKAAILALVVLAKFWWASLPALVVIVPLSLYGWEITLGSALLVAGGLAAWWRKHPASFWRCLGWFYLAKWRHYRLYRPLWQPTITNLGLATSFDGDRFYPSVIKVRRDDRGDLVTVRMLPGQHPDDWAKAAPRFAHTYHALSCTASTYGAKSGQIVLRFRLRDPLAAVIEPFPVPAVPDVRRLAVAVDEDGHVFTMSLTGHVLLAGRTGSGKASVLWSTLASLAGGIQAGTVQVHAFDPKGGMEFAYGGSIFKAFHYDQPDEMAGALEDLCKVVNQRAARYRGVSRDHTATLDEPTIVIVIDEFASLTAYVGDKKIKDRINHVMPEILTKGRAIGVYAVAALQDPRKEILSYRNLFGVRIALALNEEPEVDMVLGEGAVRRGAGAHLIPASLPGIGYVMLESRSRPMRVRFPYHTDQNIRAMANTYGKAIEVIEK